MRAPVSVRYNRSSYASVTFCQQRLDMDREAFTTLSGIVVLFVLVILVQGAITKNSVVDQHPQRNRRETSAVNIWAVKITGGEAAAERVARLYGFNNLGLVGPFISI